jgi:hypothetical protein
LLDTPASHRLATDGFGFGGCAGDSRFHKAYSVGQTAHGNARWSGGPPDTPEGLLFGLSALIL